MKKATYYLISISMFLQILATWKIWAVYSFDMLHLLHVLAFILTGILLLKSFVNTQDQPSFYYFTWIFLGLVVIVDYFVVSKARTETESYYALWGIQETTTINSLWFIIVPWIQLTAHS